MLFLPRHALVRANVTATKNESRDLCTRTVIFEIDPPRELDLAFPKGRPSELNFLIVHAGIAGIGS